MAIDVMTFSAAATALRTWLGVRIAWLVMFLLGRRPQRSSGFGRKGVSRGLVVCAATVALAIGVASGLAASEGLNGSARHGSVQVLFAPWIKAEDAFDRIDRAGGVTVVSHEGTRPGFFHAVAARPDFAARARAEGAWLVLYSR